MSVPQVMQRGLPRPDVLTALQEPASTTSQSSPLEAAEALLQAELISLLQYEAVKFPAKKRGKRKRGEEAEAVPLGPLGPWEEFPVCVPQPKRSCRPGGNGCPGKRLTNFVRASPVIRKLSPASL